MTALLAATFLLLQLLCQVFVTEGSVCETPSGYKIVPEYRAAYKTHLEHLTWDQARDRCIAEGAHLAVITSFDQLRAAVNRTVLEEEIFMFTGMRRPSFSGVWSRVDNDQPVTSVPWSAMSDEAPYPTCSVIWRGRTGSFTDHDCRDHLAFVCEVSFPEGCTIPVAASD